MSKILLLTIRHPIMRLWIAHKYFLLPFLRFFLLPGMFPTSLYTTPVFPALKVPDVSHQEQGPSTVTAKEPSEPRSIYFLSSNLFTHHFWCNPTGSSPWGQGPYLMHLCPNASTLSKKLAHKHLANFQTRVPCSGRKEVSAHYLWTTPSSAVRNPPQR